MPELSEDQRRAVERNGAEPVRITDPATQAEYVLVPADVYDRMRAVVDGVTKRAGWDDPALDEYERYRKPV